MNRGIFDVSLCRCTNLFLCHIEHFWATLQCLGLLEDHLQLLYLRSTILQEVVYKWRNGYNALDDRRFLNDPKSLASEIR
jgi:hypothetical protein